MRELMFRSAVSNSVANASYATPQVLPAEVTRIITAYHSNYEYLGIVLAITVFELGLIFFLLSGWWRLGRKMSLDTFEIGKALGVPILNEIGSNSTIDGVLKVAGTKKLKYGEMDLKYARETNTQSSMSLLSAENHSMYPKAVDEIAPGGHDAVRMRRLGLGDSGEVSDIRPGIVYY